MPPHVPEDLPALEDFDPFGGDLDARSAWAHFGGTTLEQAHAKFAEAPEVYQEDFMFMGPRAFRFYFPVIERYLLETSAADEDDDCCASILARGIEVQLRSTPEPLPAELRARILALCDYVRTNPGQYARAPEAGRWIERAWSAVRARVSARD